VSGLGVNVVILIGVRRLLVQWEHTIS